MVFQLDFATIASILAIILAVGTIVGWALKEGGRREAIRQMRQDIEKLNVRQDTSEVEHAADGKILASIQATLTALVNSVDDMRQAFLQHVSNGARNR